MYLYSSAGFTGCQLGRCGQICTLELLWCSLQWGPVGGWGVGRVPCSGVCIKWFGWLEVGHVLHCRVCRCAMQPPKFSGHVVRCSLRTRRPLFAILSHGSPSGCAQPALHTLQFCARWRSVINPPLPLLLLCIFGTTYQHSGVCFSDVALYATFMFVAAYNCYGLVYVGSQYLVDQQLPIVLSVLSGLLLL